MQEDIYTHLELDMEMNIYRYEDIDMNIYRYEDMHTDILIHFLDQDILYSSNHLYISQLRDV